MNALVNKEENDLIQERGSVEGNALKNVIRANWENRLTSVEKLKSKAMMAQLEEHATAMRKILNSYDYEIFCVPNIIANSRHMAKSEFANYLAFLESIAYGYSNILDTELVSMMLIGMTYKAKNTDTLVRHFNSIINEIDDKVEFYNSRVNDNSKVLNMAASRLNTVESSLLRFLFKRRIRRLRRIVSMKSAKIRTLEARRNHYTGVATKLKSTPRFTKIPDAPSKS